MSRLLDSLRRGRDRNAAHPVTSGRDRADGRAHTVLAALGYAGERSRRSRRRALAAAAAAVLVVATAIGAISVRWYAAPAEESVAREAPPVQPLAVTAQPPLDARTEADALDSGGNSASSAVAVPKAIPERTADGPATRPPSDAGVQPRPRAAAAAVEAPRSPVRKQAARDASRPPAPDPPVPPPAPAFRRSPAVPPAARPVTEPSVDHFKLAVFHHRAGDLDTALAHYGALLEANPMHAEAHNNLGLLYEQKGMRDEAVRAFQRAILIDPEYATAHTNLGVVLLHMGNAEGAERQFRRVLAKDAANADALTNLALAQKALGAAGLAQQTLLQALAVQPNSPLAHYNLALLYEDARETGRALEHYRAFLTHAGVEHVALADDVRKRADALAAKLTPR